MTLEEAVGTRTVRNTNLETLEMPSPTTENDKIKDDIEDDRYSK